MTRRAVFSTLALLAALAGCAVGPNYRPPVPPAGATAPLVSVRPTAESVAPPPDDWWRLYDDAELDGLVQQALAANADLAVAEANLSVARASLEGARNGLYPQTKTELGGVYGRDPTTDEILELGGHAPQTIWLFDDLLDVSYELDLFGHVRRSVEAAHADTEAAAAARDAVKITVVAETTRAYVQICVLGEQLAVARHSLDIVSHEAEITRQRHDAGAGSEFDVVRTEELVAQTRSAIPPLEGQRRAAVFQLAAMLGRTPAQAPAEATACASPPRLASLIPVGDGVGLLKRRPDVRLADRRLAAATARIGVATAELYPRVSLTGFYGGASADLSGLIAERGLVWGVGPSISWTFPNMAGPLAQVHGAKAAAAGSLAGFDSTVLQALKETEQALSTYGAELDHHQDLVDAQAKAQRALEMAHGQYVAGSLSTLDLLTSEQALVAADAAVAASDAALAQDQIAVFKALGGGWRSGDRPASR
jgi:NodT family efflux transporter outer membrane factor (OMF) lipoprotein